MPAFLLDTNILIHLMDERQSGHASAWERLRAVPESSLIAVSAIALAELDLGCCLRQGDTDEARKPIEDFLQHNGFHIEPVTRHTAPHYGELKADLCRRYQPKRARWPERWKDKPTGADIQVEEPDIIIAAQAIEHGYVLVTADAMARIRAVKHSCGELEFQDWST